MSLADYSGAAACPGCLTATEAVERASKAASEEARDVQLSLPTIHCAGCISTVERGLMARDGIVDVRVNLTRKRAVVHAEPSVTDEEIVAAISALGYEAMPLDGATLSAGESDRLARDLAMRLGVSGFAMMNVMLLSVAVWSGAADATRDLFHWISAAIALPTVVFSAQPFFKSAWSALRVARLNMDVPISLAILLASAMSLYETVNSGAHAYFDAALSLTFFLLAGRYLDQRMRSTARSAATELAAMEAPTALRLIGAEAETVPLAEVVVGDLLLVQPGARVPADGTIAVGASELDRSFLTGETDPVAVTVGSEVKAGEINLTGPLTIRTTAVGADTLLHSLAELVTMAVAAKSRYNSLADRAAQIYAPAVHLLALAAFLVWLWLTGGDVRHALNIAVAVLIITCPCGLAIVPCTASDFGAFRGSRPNRRWLKNGRFAASRASTITRATGRLSRVTRRSQVTGTSSATASKAATPCPRARPSSWWPRQMPRIGILPEKARIISSEAPASFGLQGPGERMIASGARPASSAVLIALLRRMTTSSPSSRKERAMLKTKES